MTEHYNFVVRDALGKAVVFDYDRYDVTCNRETGRLAIDRRDEAVGVGWYGVGQWVSALCLTDAELGPYLAHFVGDVHRLGESEDAS